MPETTTSQAIGDEFRDDARPVRKNVGTQTDAVRKSLPPEVLARFTVMDDSKAWLAVTQTLLGLAVGVGVGLVAWHFLSGVAFLAVLLATLCFIATQQHALFVLNHDSAHYRLFSNRRVNDIAGRLIGSSAGVSMCTYRVVHRLHHNNLYNEADPDIALNGGYPRGRRYLLKKLATDLSGLTAYKTYSYFFGAPAINRETDKASRPLDDTSPKLKAEARADRRGVVITQLALPLIVFAAFGPTGLGLYALLWLLPMLTVLQAILRVRAIAEHGAPAGYESPLVASRTNFGNWFTRFVLFPHYVNYHIEHHLYPAVPHYHLPALHEELASRGMLEGAEVREFSSTWNRVFAERQVLQASSAIVA